MEAWERRDKILKELGTSKKLIKGIEFFRIFGVSRQVIVQDIAL